MASSTLFLRADWSCNADALVPTFAKMRSKATLGSSMGVTGTLTSLYDMRDQRLPDMRLTAKSSDGNCVVLPILPAMNWSTDMPFGQPLEPQN